MAQRIDPKIIADLGEPRDVSISPDGKRIVYAFRTFWVRAKEGVTASLWLADVGVEHSARQITQGEFHDSSPRFSPDGKYISFLSDRHSPNKGSALYLLPTNGGEALPLTSKENEMGIGEYSWRSDGKAIAFTSADEKTEERKQRDKDKIDAHVYGENFDYQRVRIVDINTREVKNLNTSQNVSQIAWHSSGKKIAYASSETPETEEIWKAARLHVFDIDQDTTEEVCQVPAFVNNLCWVGANRLVWESSYDPTVKTTSHAVFSLYLNDLEKGISRTSHGEIDCVENLKFSAAFGVVVKVVHGLTDTLETLDGRELYSHTQYLISWDVHYSHDHGTIIATVQGTSGTPAEVFSELDGNRIQLSQHGKEIADKKLGRSHLCEYTHEDGTPIDGFYAIPTALEDAFTQGKPQPTVLVVRGGPYGRVTDRFAHLFQFNAFFMSLGYLVLCPNYRGGSSHGHEYAATVRHNAAASYQDVIWLVKKGIEEKRIDPDRVAITGWSQGGFMAYLAVTRDDTFHFRAAVAGAGVSDWTTMTLTSDLPLFEAELGGPAPWEVQSITDVQSRMCSPLFFMDNIKTPLLMIHGANDERVPVEQAVGFYRGLKSKAKDLDFELAVYPREGHGFPVPWEKNHFIDMLERVEKFMDKHMKDAA